MPGLLVKEVRRWWFLSRAEGEIVWLKDYSDCSKIV
jgi:hypothetical protein